MRDTATNPGAKRWKRRVFGHVLLRGRTWYIRVRRGGKDVMRAIGPTRAMAEARLAQLHVATMKKEKLGIIEPRKVSFAEFWPVLEPLLRARLAPSSYATDRTRYKVIEQYFMPRPICDIRSVDIEDFRAWLRNDREHKGKRDRASTTNRYLALLSAVFREAVRRDCALSNPVVGMKRAREEQKAVPYLKALDIERILATCPPVIRPLATVAADTGLRRGELLALEWRDVDLDRGTVTVRHSKSKRPREVPVTERARATFNELRSARMEPAKGKPDYVFAHISTLMPSWAATLVASRFRRAAIAAGFPELSFHGLRHSYCSRLAQAGVPLPTIRALAGHGSLTITSRYASHLPKGAEVLAVHAMEAAEQAVATKGADDETRSSAGESAR